MLTSISLLTIILVIGITLIPSNIVRIIIGLPFLLFFPGYTLLEALYIKKEDLGLTEKLALSTGISIAIVALIGFILNYTNWGIKPDLVLYSIAGFILIMTVIALIIRVIKHNKPGFTIEYIFDLTILSNIRQMRSFSLILIILILGAAGILGYNAVNLQARETYSEFYILGINGQAKDYPVEYILENGQVQNVRYDNDASFSERAARIIIGIINNEAIQEIYHITAKIDGKPLDLQYQGLTVRTLGPIELNPGEKWEQEVQFAPQRTGTNQEVQFVLLKNENDTVENVLQIWIDVKEAK